MQTNLSFGVVESRRDAKNCEKISGVIVALPDFGDEKAVADTLRMTDLKYFGEEMYGSSSRGC